MTLEQYNRWKDFALRMARRCWTNRHRPSRDWIVEQVEDFFSALDELDIPCIVDWCNNDPYPPEHPYHGKSFYGHDRSATLICDWISEWETDTLFYECEQYATARERRWLEAVRDPGDMERYDEIAKEIVDRWSTPVRCCIRAGLDCASAPSLGVVGFTAGDVRRMYPEGLPEWLFPADERLHYWLSGKVDGYFRDLADSVGVVL